MVANKKPVAKKKPAAKTLAVRKAAAAKAAARKESVKKAAAAIGEPTRIGGLTIDAFAKTVFEPARNEERSVAVREALEGVTDGAAAWEVLAARGLIPMTWVTEPARMVLLAGKPCPCIASIDEAPERRKEYELKPLFTMSTGETVEGKYVDGFGHQPGCPVAWVPPSVAAARTLALDVEGVCAAELLARECVRRRWPDEARSPLIAWRLQEETMHDAVSAQRPAGSIALSSPRPIAQAERALVGALMARNPPMPETQWRSVVRAVQLDAARLWRWEGHPTEKRLNPFVPLCELWTLGYMFDTLASEHVILRAIIT